MADIADMVDSDFEISTLSFRL